MATTQGVNNSYVVPFIINPDKHAPGVKTGHAGVKTGHAQGVS